jgi:hypothetical protein
MVPGIHFLALLDMSSHNAGKIIERLTLTLSHVAFLPLNTLACKVTNCRSSAKSKNLRHTQQRVEDNEFDFVCYRFVILMCFPLFIFYPF